MRTTIVTAGAVAATAAIGGVAADPGSAWYRSLRKPRWQPPPPAYALVWTPLYVTIATQPPGRSHAPRAARTAAVLLVPYAGWTAFATALNAEIVRLNPSA